MYFFMRRETLAIGRTAERVTERDLETPPTCAVL